MFLSDVDIKKAVKAGDLTLSDFDKNRVQPASYDILLGNKFIVNDAYLSGYIDPVNKIYAKTHEINLKDNETFILHPGISVLGSSHDFIGSDKYLVQLGGKSSLARIGLMVHNTAGLINPGDFLNITLELCNLNNIPIILRPKMRIAQLTFSIMSSPPERSYKQIGRFYGNNWNNFVPPKDEVRKEAQGKKKTNKRLKPEK